MNIIDLLLLTLIALCAYYVFFILKVCKERKKDRFLKILIKLNISLSVVCAMAALKSQSWMPIVYKEYIRQGFMPATLIVVTLICVDAAWLYIDLRRSKKEINNNSVN